VNIPQTLFLRLGEGWALREEVKKAYRLNNKKVCFEKMFAIGQSSRRKVDADAVPGTEISRIASFGWEVSDCPALATSFF